MTKYEAIQEIKDCFMNAVYGFDDGHEEYDNIIRFNRALTEIDETLDKEAAEFATEFADRFVKGVEEMIELEKEEDEKEDRVLCYDKTSGRYFYYNQYELEHEVRWFNTLEIALPCGATMNDFYKRIGLPETCIGYKHETRQLHTYHGEEEGQSVLVVDYVRE